jgi:hypothetical protein
MPLVASCDLKILRRRWQEAALKDFDEAVALELAKINQLEAERWEAWRRSIGEKQKKLREKVAAGAGGARDKASVQTEDLIGNPAYLQGVERCIERRCKLLGLNAPKRIAPTDPTGRREFRGLADLLESMEGAGQ